MSVSFFRRPSSAVAVLALGSLVLAGCSANGDAGAEEVKTIKEGTLTVGVNMVYPPMEYFEKDGSTPTGVDMDLATEVAKRMDLELDVQVTAWDGLIPGTKSKRYDAVWSSIGDFTDRQKQVDFVDYLSIQSGVVVNAKDKKKYTSQNDLCGKTVGGTKGSVAITIAQDFSAECKDAGMKPVKISEFEDGATGLLALRSGRSDAQILDGPSAVYQAKTAGGGKSYAVAIDAVGPVAIYGVGVNKADTGLRDAIADELNAMIDDGSYQKILDKYGVGAYAIDSATVNAGGEQ